MKTKNIIIASFLTTLFISSFSCVKDEKETNSNQVNGMILYFGDPAVDGCGWVIKTDTIVFSPIELESEFKIDSLKVTFEFKLLDTWWKCGWREPGYQQIEIEKINALKE